MKENNLSIDKLSNLSSEEKLDFLFDLIIHTKNCAALTGAGVSTLSGIRDFRGKNGLYNDMDAQKIFDIDYFNRDPAFIIITRRTSSTT
jgi:NAD-dependent deacetylase